MSTVGWNVRTVWGYPLALAAVTAATLLAVAPDDGPPVAAAVAAFLLAVLASAACGGSGPGLLAAGVAAVVTSYLVLTPYGRFTVDWLAAELSGYYLAAVPAGCLAASALNRWRRSRVPRRLRPLVARALGRVPAFKGLSPDAVRGLAASAAVRHAAPREPLPGLGDAGAEFFLVVSGKVEVRRDGTVTDVLGPARWYGEPALVTGDVRPDAFTARTGVSLIVLSRAAYRRAAGPG
ncbi:MAG TPA: cyclic nucleotide-binding domain-containing protein [Humisphaera sp.]